MFRVAGTLLCQSSFDYVHRIIPLPNGPSRPPSTPRGSDSREALGAPRGATYLGLPRTLSDLPSSRRFSPHIPRSSWTPADPRGPHPRGPSVWASGTLTPSPSAFRSYGAVSSFRECGLPCGLCGSLCPLQLVRSGSHPSSPTATLGTGGWLGLPRQGLSPCKKRQASLGALTICSAAGPHRRSIWHDAGGPSAAAKVRRATIRIGGHDESTR